MNGLQHAIWSNRLKTCILIFLFPLLLFLIFFGLFYVNSFNSNEYIPSDVYSFRYDRATFVLQQTNSVFFVVLFILILRLFVAFLFHRRLIFSFSGAKPISRKENPEIYNIVENLCISRGLPVPKIGIIDTAGMNAFALGWRASDSWIVFTRGLLKNLEKAEIEAVAGHELTHIINKDSLLMMVIVLYIGAVSFMGRLLIRSGGRSNSKNRNLLPLIGLVCVLLGYLFYPLIRLAISRKREYLADAGSVGLIKDNQAMISALKKISNNSKVPIENNVMASMFISNPLPRVQTLFQTHPSLEDRIKALESY